MSKNKLFEITFSDLVRIFPDSVLWASNYPDLVGYSKSLNKHYIIENGLCKRGYNYEYKVHIYSPNNPKEHEFNWFVNGVVKRKYIDFEGSKIFEDFISFMYRTPQENIKKITSKANISSVLSNYKIDTIKEKYVANLFKILPGLKYLKKDKLINVILHQTYFTQILLKNKTNENNL